MEAPLELTVDKATDVGEMELMKHYISVHQAMNRKETLQSAESLGAHKIWMGYQTGSGSSSQSTSTSAPTTPLSHSIKSILSSGDTSSAERDTPALTINTTTPFENYYGIYSPYYVQPGQFGYFGYPQMALGPQWSYQLAYENQFPLHNHWTYQGYGYSQQLLTEMTNHQNQIVQNGYNMTATNQVPAPNPENRQVLFVDAMRRRHARRDIYNDPNFVNTNKQKERYLFDLAGSLELPQKVCSRHPQARTLYRNYLRTTRDVDAKKANKTWSTMCMEQQETWEILRDQVQLERIQQEEMGIIYW